MMVPITSDLEGYEHYWSRIVHDVAVGLGLVVAVIIVELGLIIWLLWARSC